MSRSGETLVLRCLNAHSKIGCVHQLIDGVPGSTELFTFLSDYEPTRIPKTHHLVNHENVDSLVMKQGVWEHKYPFDGFILSRNPLSIYSSLKEYEKRLKHLNKSIFYKNEKMESAMLRWAKGIDVALPAELMKTLSPIEQFAKFYNRRMGALFNLPNMIVTYEGFVMDPEKQCRRICKEFGLHFEEKMTTSHESYGNITGHGGIKMNAPIHIQSVEKYKDKLSSEEIELVKEGCGELAKKYGYDL